MSEPFDFEPLIDVNEVARLFKFTPQHIRRLAERKVIPAARYGREWRFRRSDLNRAFQEASTGPKHVDLFSMPKEAPAPLPRRPRGRPRNNS